jgi:hypothetical protein
LVATAIGAFQFDNAHKPPLRARLEFGRARDPGRSPILATIVGSRAPE